MRRVRDLLTILVLVFAAVSRGDETSTDATPRRLFLRGDYPTAQAAYEGLLARSTGVERVAAAAGLVEVYSATGEYELARELLVQELKTNPESVELWGRLAELQFATGDWQGAQQSAENAVRRDTDAIRGRLILAHLHREAGRLEEAGEGYRWCVRYYNRRQPKDAVTLRLVAEGSLEYARWKGVSTVFHFVINTLCPDALQDDPDDWRSAVLSGDVLLEKYNEPAATPEYEAAVQLNPLSAEAHAGLAKAAVQRHEIEAARKSAEQALVINPRLVDALLLLAKLELDAEQLDAAQALVDRAQAVNPLDQRVLAAQSKCDMLREGLPDQARFAALMAAVKDSTAARPAPASRAEQRMFDLVSRNPKPGAYLNELGEYFDDRKKYALAVAAYQTAVDLMPQLAAARTNLGLLDMRIGKVAEAEAILNSAFKSDPFHVRVSNMRKVIGVLNGYETVRTEHFVIRVDKSDRLLAEYMAEYLEELHSELTQTYGFVPAAPTQFEVYSAAQGQTAHQWFSARMTGLPWIQTIGASTGMIVALASPQAVEESFNWGRVLRHEYVHILTLQQTDFNIPHWFTEALAVRTEGIVLDQDWKDLLMRRVPAGEVFDLHTINGGFQHPEGPDDWNMAYCQSRHYARFLEQNWGAESLTKLIAAYAQGHDTPEAIRQVSGLELPQFESQYRDYLTALVKSLVEGQAKPEIELDAARLAWEAASEDAALSGRYAYALWKAGDEMEARRRAEATYDLQSGEPLATVVLLAYADQDQEQELADALIAEAHDPQHPHAVLLGALAERAFNRGQVAEALELFRLGVDKFPWEDSFYQGLAVAYISQQQPGLALPLMAEIAHRNPENVTVRAHLASQYLSAGDIPAARKWAQEVLFNDLEHAAAHVVLGECWLDEKQVARAHEEFERALEFEPGCIAARIGLVKCERVAGNTAEAQRLLEMLRRDHPEDATVKALEVDGATPEN